MEVYVVVSGMFDASGTFDLHRLIGVFATSQDVVSYLDTNYGGIVAVHCPLSVGFTLDVDTLMETTSEYPVEVVCREGAFRIYKQPVQGHTNV